MSYHEQMSIRMAEAAASGKYVVIQPAFETIPEKHEPRLSNLNERHGLGDVFAFAAAEWQQRHRREHTVFQVGSVDRLISVVRAFKEHKEAGEITIDRLMISKHRSMIPWGSFYPDTSEGRTSVQRSGKTMHVRQVFDALYASAARQTYRNLIPSLAPVLRTNLSRIEQPVGKSLLPQHVSTNSVRQVIVDGESVRLRDMLVVPDPELKARIEDAPSFSLVATPYLQRWSLSEGVDSAREYRLSSGRTPVDGVRPVCMFWHIGSEKQLSFEC